MKYVEANSGVTSRTARWSDPVAGQRIFGPELPNYETLISCVPCALPARLPCRHPYRRGDRLGPRRRGR
jgi:hypothetical protein